MKIRLIRTYIREGDESDLAFLNECISDGDDQGLDEFFDLATEQKIDRLD